MSRFRISATLAAAVLALAACSGGQSATSESAGASAGAPQLLTVDSGRSEELIAPLFAKFTEETGIELAARYGDSAELAAQLVEEGDASPAAVLNEDPPTRNKVWTSMRSLSLRASRALESSSTQSKR